MAKDDRYARLRSIRLSYSVMTDYERSVWNGLELILGYAGERGAMDVFDSACRAQVIIEKRAFLRVPRDIRRAAGIRHRRWRTTAECHAID